MSKTYMERTIAQQVLAIANGAAVSDIMTTRGFAGGMLLMPAAWTSASIGFKVCNAEGGTFLPLYDHTATLVQIPAPAVDRAYEIPPEVFAAPFVQLWSQNGSGTNTNQGAARSVPVMMKS